MKPIVLVKLVDPSAILPKYQTDGAAGMDLHVSALFESVEHQMPADRIEGFASALIIPGTARAFGTGIAVAIPPGYEGHVRSRSGVACKNLVIIPNSIGSIDSDYRGEIKVVLLNLGRTSFLVHKGDRIAQLMIVPTPQVELEVVDELPASARGEGGFGSTGTAP